MLTVQAGDHTGTTVSSAAQFADNTIAFAEQGLACGAKVMVFPAATQHDLVRRAIATAGTSVTRALHDGRLELADSRQVQLATGSFDPPYLRAAYAGATAQTVAAGFSGLWVCVDMAWAGPGVADPAALTDFEATAYPLFTGGQLTALCQYDTRVFPRQQAQQACQAHPSGVAGVQLRHHRSPNQLELTGQTDMSNHLAWKSIIADLEPGDRLDVTAMSFMDVAAMVAVLNAAALTPGLLLIATGMQERVLKLLGLNGNNIQIVEAHV